MSEKKLKSNLLGQNQKKSSMTMNNPLEDSTSAMSSAWDPLHSPDWDSQILGATCLGRIRSDIKGFSQDPPPGIFIQPDLNHIHRINALILGPSGTPYQNGFFHFILRFPPDYPIRPPRCRLLTTGNGTVRFNPNFYKNGKVCLSLLGTWSGPAWSPAQCLSSLLLSIQSLMSEYPYHNEPGYENERVVGAAQLYNDIIQHETLRVAVCETLENSRLIPEQLRTIVQEKFREFYSSYVQRCEKCRENDGKEMIDPFGDRRGIYSYASILKRLEEYKLKSDLLNNEQTIDSNAFFSISSSSNVTITTSLFDENDMREIFCDHHIDDEEDQEEEEE